MLRRQDLAGATKSQPKATIIAEDRGDRGILRFLGVSICPHHQRFCRKAGLLLETLGLYLFTLDVRCGHSACRCEDRVVGMLQRLLPGLTIGRMLYCPFFFLTPFA